ncbi:twin-arginine translocase subunit TatB [Rhodobacteraceae bacterium CCMM004]|nr:twin-arginine translocase subunit TatB [Rhodobacteraceae bacterium CCMM004]
MFDIGMTELLVIGIVALIVVGPKDLPGMFRTLGRFTAKVKGMAREFQRAMDDAADQAGVKDVAKDLKSATSSKNLGLDRLNQAADKFEKWDPSKATKSRGPATSQMTAERAEAAEKIRAASAEAALKRQAAEAQTAAADPATPASPAKTTGTAADTPLTAPKTDET